MPESSCKPSVPMIRNPYSTSDSNQNSNSSLQSLSSKSSNTIEEIIRKLLRSTAVPSLASITNLKEQLAEVNQGTIGKWSNETAFGLGTLVLRCIHSYLTSNARKQSILTRIEDVTSVLLGLFSEAVEEWEDHSIYTVLLQEEENDQSTYNGDSTYSGRSLLDLLVELLIVSGQSTGEYGRLHRVAIVCLSNAWRCLDRMEQLTAQTERQDSLWDGETPWWTPDDSEALLVLGKHAYQSLCSVFDRSNQVPSRNSHQNSHPYGKRQQSDPKHIFSLLSILTVSMRYRPIDISPIFGNTDDGGAIISNDRMIAFVSNLLHKVEILCFPDTTPPISNDSLPIAIQSMSVLSLLQKAKFPSNNESLFHGLEDSVRSTALVDNLIQLTFEPKDATRTIPITPKESQSTRSLCLQLFSYWKLCDSYAWQVLMDKLQPRLVSIVDPFWSHLLTKSTADLASFLESRLCVILWLHTYAKIPSRRRLAEISDPSITQRNTNLNERSDNQSSFKDESQLERIPISNLFDALLHSKEMYDSTRLMTARFLYILLSDRRIVSTHDNLSYSLWHELDRKVTVQHLLERILEQSNTEDAKRPLLLVLSDLLEVLLEFEDSTKIPTIEKLGAQSLERLIYLINPRDLRYDFSAPDVNAFASNISYSLEEHTPPLNNLSRLDETSICIEHEDTKIARGLDHSVRLTVATVLARLASCKDPTDESASILISRISKAVHDCLMEYHELLETNLNEGGRSVLSIDQTKRLLRLSHSIDAPETQEFLIDFVVTSHGIRRSKRKEWMEIHAKMENTLNLAQEREKQAQKEIARLKHQLRAQSIIFQRELTRIKMNASQEASHMISMHVKERSRAENRAKDFRRQVESATVQLETFKTQAQISKEELHAKLSQMNELQSTVEALRQQVKDSNDKNNQLFQQVNSNREAFDSIEKKCGVLQKNVNEKNDAIASLEDGNNELEANLEDLFADMCSLAQIHRHIDEQQKSREQERTEEIHRLLEQLSNERRRNDDKTSQIAKIQEENEKLYRKLGKYKERLEQERSERRCDHQKRKTDEQRRKRNGPVSYLNSLHNNNINSDNNSNSSAASSRRHPDGSLSRSEKHRQNHQHNNMEQSLSSRTNRAEEKENRRTSQHRPEY